MEEKLLVNRYDEGLNVPGCKERTYKRRGSCCRRRAQMCRLTKLASCLVLSLDVGVNQGLGGKQCEQDRHSKGKYPNRVAPRVVPVGHFDS